MDARRRRFPRESRPWLRARRHPDARLALRSRTLADVAASALRVPRIAALLAAGAAIGPHALGLLELPPDSLGAQLLLTLGVSFILFHGGAELSLPVLRSVALGLGLLAVPGVLLTALVTGAVAALAFDIPFTAGLLIGAVLAPTDPAILIPLLERIQLRARIRQTLVAESALNDPVGAVLALAVAAFALEADSSFADPVGAFVADLALSTALGVVFGVALAVMVSTRRAGIWRDSPVLAVLLILSVGYFSIDWLGGSGYLGAFIAGVIAGNMDALRLGMHSARERELRTFARAVSDVNVVLVFLSLGANLPFDTLADHAAPALVTLAALIAVARPLTVLVCLLPDRRARWRREELLFIAWTRETGVLPAALAGILVAEGIPHEEELVTVVSLAIRHPAGAVDDEAPPGAQPRPRGSRRLG